jgi:hypothetical protein
MAEQGPEGARKEKVQRGVAGGDVGQGQPINRLVELRVEIVNPELLATFVSSKFSLSVLVRCDAGWHTPPAKMEAKKYKNI